MRKLFLFLHLFFSTTLFAQVTDDFSDGDFTNNPMWSGNTAKFIVNASKQLQLNDVGANIAYLSTASPDSFINNSEWQFYIKLAFSPSGNNYALVYLASDQSNLASYQNGYCLQFGEIGSADAITLFRVTNNNTGTMILRGTTSIAAAFAVRVKVTRDNNGLWNLFVDPTGGKNFQLEASGIDNTYNATKSFGVVCVYTTSNSTKFYFDDFYVNTSNIDTNPPTIDSVQIISSTKLDIVFSEPVDKTTAETISNYSVNNGIGNPVSALKDDSNTGLVHLTFTTAFTDGLKNTITINNIQDTIGNIINTNGSKDFTFSLPVVVKFLDVVINEIMADPDPPVALPNHEYVEFFNRTNVPINLNKWTFSTNTTEVVIPDVTISPNDFLILCSTTAKPLLQSYGNVVGISNFPALTNTGTTLILKDNLQRIISTVSYTDDWYQDAQKKDGGWSLEQIDLNNPCAGSNNWKASTDKNGGTPGKKNSADGITSDSPAPYILRASVIDSIHIQVFFSKPMDSSSIMNPTDYEIDNGIGKPTSLTLVAPDYISVILNLAKPIQRNVIYTVDVSNPIRDCAGNNDLTIKSTKFAIPIPADNFDIVINEILFDPKEEGYDFVEIYNRSNKVIDLKDLRLASGDYVTAKLDDIKQITTSNYLIFPQDYLVLTFNADVLEQQYNGVVAKNVIALPSMPAFNIEYDIVALTTASGKVIDQFKYTATMHFPLLNTTKGVSLERLNFDRATQDSTNWHSASETVGFATPSYKNSQYTDGKKTANPITITPEIFSPDDDGHNDVANINYHFDTPDFVANITLYDVKGKLIRYLVKNKLLGNNGSFAWDGITETKEKARIGIYIVSFEVFDVSGNVKQYKKSCVLSGKL